jgi:hypothetical protein
VEREMKKLADISLLLKSWPLAAALLVASLSSSRADDNFDTILLDATPAAAPVPATAEAPAPTVAQEVKPQPANKDAKRKEVSKIVWLVAPIAYPTIYPNPLAFNMVWVTVSDRTFARVRALARRQQQKLNRVQVVIPALQNPAGQNGIQQQLRKFLEPMLTVELSFAARAADLDLGQRNQLRADGKAWFDKFIVEYVKKLDPNQQNMLLQNLQGAWFGNQQQTFESPRQVLRTGIAKLVQDTFPKDKAALYADECKKRDEFARQVSVDNLVERLDAKLKLAPDQWKKITKTLNEHADKKQESQLEGLVFNQSMLPAVPQELVLPELSPAQQAAMTRLNASVNQMFFGGGVFGQMLGGNAQVIDDDGVDVNGEVARPAAPAATSEAE